MMTAAILQRTYLFTARQFHTGACYYRRLQRRGREVNAITDQIRQIPDHNPLTKGDFATKDPERLSTIDPTLDDAEKRIPMIPREMAKFEDFVQTKITEKKYLEDMYRIEPGEKYSIKKDVKNSIQKGVAKPYWKQSFFQNLSKQSPPADAALKVKKISPLVQIFTVDSNPYSRHATNSNPVSLRRAQNSIPSRAPNDVYKSSMNSSVPYPETYKRLSNEANSSEPESSAKNEAESTELDEAAVRERKGPLLLWSMRAQMKHLHESDTDHWTPHLLSHVFLVSEEKVKKVLKSRWYPSSEVEAAEYDKLILQNWEKFSKDGGRAFSVALVKKAIEKRLEEYKKGVSGLPAIPGEHADKLSQLIFEDPPEARRQGLIPRASKASRESGDQNGVEMVNIVRSYQRALKQLRGSPQTEEGNSSPADGAAAKSRNIVTHDGSQNVNDALAPEGRSNRRAPINSKKKLVTLEEFLRKKR